MADTCMLLVTSQLILLSLSFPLRCALGVKEKTHCLFQALLRSRERELFSNPLYEPTELAIWPSVHPQSLQLWRGEFQLVYAFKLDLILFELSQAYVFPTGFFLRWTQQARHLEEAQEEIRNMIIEWGKLALS